MFPAISVGKLKEREKKKEEERKKFREKGFERERGSNEKSLQSYFHEVNISTSQSFVLSSILRSVLALYVRVVCPSMFKPSKYFENTTRERRFRIACQI